MTAIRSIVEEKGTIIHAIAAEATVLDAVLKMCRKHVGALLVDDGGVTLGILSERDIMTRVVLQRRDPSSTTVGEVMTREIVCIESNREPEEAMAVMTERHVRHLPVMDHGEVIGLVSIGDLVRWASHNQESEIRMLQDYVAG